jgi:hypothetical protein
VTRRSLIAHEVFDQDGRLIATDRSPSGSKVGRLFGSTGVYRTPDGRPVLTVLVDRRTCVAVDQNNVDVGTVTMRGKHKGVIHVDRAEIGRLARSSEHLAAAGRTAFSLYDLNSVEVARITTTSWALVRWSVIEARSGPGDDLRRLLLAADAAVADWTTPKGGG